MGLLEYSNDELNTGALTQTHQDFLRVCPTTGIHLSYYNNESRYSTVSHRDAGMVQVNATVERSQSKVVRPTAT
jgi:hypothetical protein